MFISKFRGRNGITLIALVITIIVLLILAGVTIAMVVGDNGILSRSREAKDTTNIKKIQEEVDLEAADLVAEYHTKDSGEVTGSAGEYVATQIDGKTINGIEIEADSEEMTITAEKDGITTSGTIEANGHIIWDDENSTVAGGGSGTGEQGGSGTGSGTGTEEGSSSDSGSGGTPATTTIATTDYGKYVDIGVDINSDGNTTNDFRVFLNDGSNVYLIAADYVPYSMLPYSKGNNTTNGHALNKITDYKVYFSNILNDYSGSSDIVSNFSSQLSTYHKWVNNNQTGTYATKNNIKSVAYTLDKTAWNSIYKTSNNSSYVDYVVGGPTLEQFKESFNQIHTEAADQIFYSESGNTGYYVNKGSAPTTQTSAQFSTADSNLYFIKAKTKAYDAWLASPSANHENRVMGAGWNGYVSYLDYDASAVGFRPLVSLKSGVSLADSDSDEVYDFN